MQVVDASHLTRAVVACPPGQIPMAEQIASRLSKMQGVTLWFAPWHTIPGRPLIEQLEAALQASDVCIVIVDDGIASDAWYAEQMRVAIQTRVEDNPTYRVIPVIISNQTSDTWRLQLPLLRRHAAVRFASLDDENAFRHLLAGVWGIAPIDVDRRLGNSSANARASQSSAPNAHPSITTMPSLKRQPQAVFDALAKYFDESELHMLSFSLDVDYEDLAGASRTDKAMALVTYCDRRGRLSELSRAIQAARPNADLRLGD